jgi:hypothetical protein
MVSCESVLQRRLEEKEQLVVVRADARQRFMPCTQCCMQYSLMMLILKFVLPFDHRHVASRVAQDLALADILPRLAK